MSRPIPRTTIAHCTANAADWNTFSPISATQFGLLIAAQALPIDYMQAIDGQAYGAGGLAGTFTADALLSLGACAVLLPFVLRWQRTGALAAG